MEINPKSNVNERVNMDEKKNSVPWYKCKRDIGITLLITIVAYLLNPIYNTYKVTRTCDDMGILGGLVITAFVFTASLLICPKHFWIWVAVTTFTVTGAAQISRGYPENFIILDKVLMIAVNGAILLSFFTIPAAAIVYFTKKIIKNGLTWQTIREIPSLIVLLAIIWELFLIWFIFG